MFSYIQDCDVHTLTSPRFHGNFIGNAKEDSALLALEKIQAAQQAQQAQQQQAQQEQQQQEQLQQQQQTTLQSPQGSYWPGYGT